jgi:hypothetical protein
MTKNQTRGVALLDLRSGECRFPVRADPSVPGGHRFCAEATLPDRVYCAHHHGIVTTAWPRTRKSVVSSHKKRAA